MKSKSLRLFLCPLRNSSPFLALLIAIIAWHPRASAADLLDQTLKRYCIDCHDSDQKKGDMNLEGFSLDKLSAQSDVAEKIVRKLRVRQMPPVGKKRPNEETYNQVVTVLSKSLDSFAKAHPNPGRTETFRRLNRTEYQNAIRDLLDLEIDAAALLPKDEASHGFDNVTVGDLSPTLLDRYITAAQKISRLAVGSTVRPGNSETIRVRPDLTQEEHVEGLPLGTRGGVLLPYTFPQNGEYEVQVRLARDRNEHVEGLHEPHEVEVLLDSERVQLLTVAPPVGRKDYEAVDQHLKIRFPATAGPHKLGVTFIKNPSSLQETKRQPYAAHFNMHRHPRLSPAVYQVTIAGPFSPTGAGDTPSRRRIFVNAPAGPKDEEASARKIISTLMRRAYRRAVTSDEVDAPLGFYRKARMQGGFDSGIEAALEAILISPEFLFRIERDPEGQPPGTVYALSDTDLASRLSFFIWSSIPDDELLDLATRGDLHKRDVLDRQVRRMLADPRSSSLVSNFGGQWLYLRNLDSASPDQRLFPDFDDNLRQAFRQETELLFGEILREDRSVLAFLKSDHAYLNERLAKHYGVDYVYGSRFRKVPLDSYSERGGLLRQGSILTVTSYATRTSPVIRGNWILGNLLGTPPPPPPGNVPALKDNPISATLSVRQRLSEHRANVACAGCHNLMDPVGFSLDNFDAVGRWRDNEEGLPIDANGGLPDGSQFVGVSGLEEGLLKRPENFVSTLAEKLLVFALGRGIDPSDGPAVRKIVSDAKAADYRISEVIAGVVRSVPFQMRKTL